MEVKLTGKKGIDILKELKTKENKFKVIKNLKNTVIIDIPGYGDFQTKFFEVIPNQYLLLINDLQQTSFENPEQENQRLSQIIKYYELYIDSQNSSSQIMEKIRPTKPTYSYSDAESKISSAGFEAHFVGNNIKK